jgi:hypothetical protein
MTCTQRHVACITCTILPTFAPLPYRSHDQENARWTHQRRVGTPLTLAMGISVRLVRIFSRCAHRLMIRHATWTGAGMMGHTPERNWNRTQGGNTRQRPKDQDEDLMQDLKLKEKSLNAVFISVRALSSSVATSSSGLTTARSFFSKAGAISASIVYRIVYNIRNIQNVPQPFLFAAIHSHFSQGTTTSMAAAAPPAPLPSASPGPLDHFDPPPTFDMCSSRIVRMNVYWVTGLVFSVSAVVLAMLGKHMIRDCRDRLALRRHIKATPIRSLWDGTAQGLAMFAATDTMYRLFQVALVLVLLGHIDALVISVGVTVFAPIVGCGVLYVFGFIGAPVMRDS